MSKLPKFKALLSLTLVALASIVAYVTYIAAPSNTSKLPPSLSFELRDESGASIDWQTVGEQNIILHFWATWCAPCIEELPELDAYMASLPANTRIVPISLDGHAQAAKVAEFISTQELVHIPTYTASFAQVSRTLRIRQLPTTIWLHNGSEVRREAGVVEWHSE